MKRQEATRIRDEAVRLEQISRKLMELATRLREMSHQMWVTQEEAYLRCVSLFLCHCWFSPCVVVLPESFSFHQEWGV